MEDNELTQLIIALEANTKAVKELIELDHTLLQVLVEELMGEDDEEPDPTLTING